ncbi:MAG: peptidoglycan DD-metalloendopeptidase family protein [Burkholderiaceae bacterium]|nr:peptidoglycan DD-metalloendopeptidase family protein [Burkholderiaceae bacterium]
MKNNVLLQFSRLALIALLAALAACSTPMSPAPIVDRNGTSQPAAQQPAQPAAAAAPAGHTGDERGYYQVKKGDTLTHIALDNGQSPRDIATWNNLANPNDIKVGQVLRVLPPEDNGAVAGSQSNPVPPQGGIVRTPLAPQGAQSMNKTGPRGEKKPYSDAALADMQKPDAAAAVTAASPAAAAPTAADKAAEASPAEEAVTWAWPADGKLMAPYDESKKGIDIAGKNGQQVMAAANGKVLFVGTMRGYGNLVIVKHTNALLSAYAHNKTILVKEGQPVTRGQPIAEMGDSDTDAVKLHFEVRQQGKPVDPTKFLPPR